MKLFDKEMKKEKLNLFKEKKSSKSDNKLKVNKDLKNVLVGAGAILLGVKALEVLSD